MRNRYRTSIPGHARELVVETYPCGAKKRAEYRVKGRIVGLRWFDESGNLNAETPLKNGKRHGREYHWLCGNLDVMYPHENGLEHGTTRQWSESGQLIGSYRLKRGTGLDLWRRQREDGSIYLAEAVYRKNMLAVGYLWHINEDQRSVSLEQHYNSEGQPHGISREWNSNNRLRRGFPVYEIMGQKVTKRQYIAACKSDATLPPYRREDDDPARSFPPRITKWLMFNGALP